MILSDGNAAELETEAEIQSYGISIKQGNMTSTLHVFSDDETLYDYKFELRIKSTVQEEPTWYNITQVKINYFRPPCEVSQEEISAVGGG